MQQFTETHLGGFGTRQLDEFEAVLDIPDQHVFDWIMGRETPAGRICARKCSTSCLSFRYSAPHSRVERNRPTCRIVPDAQ